MTLKPGDQVLCKRTEKKTYRKRNGEYVKSEVPYECVGVLVGFNKDLTRAKVAINSGVLKFERSIPIEQVELLCGA